MASRSTQQNKNPEVEESAVELERLEGEKQKIQNEMLDIVATNKRLITEGEAQKEKIEEEVAQKRQEGDAELEAFNRAIATTKSVKKQLENEVLELRILVSDRDNILISHQEAKEKLTGILESIKKTTNELTGLTSNQNTLLAQIKGHHEDIDSKMAEKQSLDERISLLKKEEDSLKNSHTELVTIIGKAVNDKESSIAEKEIKIKELNQILDEISKRRLALMQLQTEISTLEEKVAEHTTTMTEKEASISERIAIAARLEEHVDGKLQHLKEIEKMFTIEHLARIGYKKTE